MMVAEAWVHAERLPLYLRPGEYHQSFNFDLLEADWSAEAFRNVIERSVSAANDVGAASTWVLSNHDVVRHATRYGLPPGTESKKWLLDGPHGDLNPELGARRARAAALISLSLPGSTYVYQGEELGLPEVWDLPTGILEDPVWERSAHTEKGRDGCRVPLPWQPTGPSLGFGVGKPWLPQPPMYAQLAASVQAQDPSSSLSLYRRAIALRRELMVSDENLEMLDFGPGVLAYARAQVVVVANMGSDPVSMPDGEVILASETRGLGASDALMPDSAVWLRRT